MWFSSFMPDENSQLQCDASHRNKKNRELPRTAVCSGTACRLFSLCGSSGKAGWPWLGLLRQKSGLFGTDAAVAYLISLRCLAAVIAAIPVPPSSPLQPAITVAPLPTTLLLPVEKAVLCQSLILGAEKFNFVYAVEKPWVTPRHWWCSAAGGVLSEM